MSGLGGRVTEPLSVAVLRTIGTMTLVLPAQRTVLIGYHSGVIFFVHDLIFGLFSSF